LLDVAVTKLDGVGDKERFGVGIDDLEAVVVVESGSDVETRASAESPGGSHGGFVVDDDWTSHGAQRGGIIVEGSMEVFPGGKGRGKGGLAEEVEGEFCLGEEFIPQVVGEAVVNAG